MRTTSLLISLTLVAMPLVAQARVPNSPVEQISRRTLLENMEKQSRSVPDASARLFTDETYGIHAYYPTGWTPVKDDYAFLNAKRLVYFLPPNETEDSADTAISIVVEEPSMKNVETYLIHAVSFLKDSFTNFTPIESDSLTVDREKALSIVFTADGDPKVKVKEVFVLRNSKTYILSLWSTPESYDRHLEAFGKVVDWFSVAR